MNIVSIIIDIVFLVSVLVGWWRGLFKVIVSVAGLVLSLAVGLYVSPHLSGYLEKHTLIDDHIAEYIAKELEFSESGEGASKGIQVAVIKALPFPDEMKSNILNNNNSEMYKALEVSGIYDYIAKSIAVVILNVGVFFVVAFVCRLFFYFFIKGLGEFTKLPIVRWIDKIGGGLLGGMKGIILIWLFFLIVSITGTTVWSQEIIAQINESVFLKLLYENNLLLDIVGDLTRVLFF